jgi:hypothetical protein
MKSASVISKRGREVDRKEQSFLRKHRKKAQKEKSPAPSAKLRFDFFSLGRDGGNASLNGNISNRLGRTFGGSSLHTAGRADACVAGAGNYWMWTVVYRLGVKASRRKG